MPTGKISLKLIVPPKRLLRLSMARLEKQDGKMKPVAMLVVPSPAPKAVLVMPIAPAAGFVKVPKAQDNVKIPALLTFAPEAHVLDIMASNAPP